MFRTENSRCFYRALFPKCRVSSRLQRQEKWHLVKWKTQFITGHPKCLTESLFLSLFVSVTHWAIHQPPLGSQATGTRLKAPRNNLACSSREGTAAPLFKGIADIPRIWEVCGESVFAVTRMGTGKKETGQVAAI